MEVGVEFEGESNLELKNPENLEEMAVKTEVEMYFNVTDRESDDRAFLMYMGNEASEILASWHNLPFMLSGHDVMNEE